MDKIYNFVKSKKMILISVICLEMLFWLVVFLSKGELLGTYFHNFDKVSQMDFFQMLGCVNESNPYIKDANYPALCFVILKCLNHMIPINLRTTDGFVLKELMSGQVVFLFYIAIISIYLLYEVRALFDNYVEKDLATMVTILSGPYLFCLERGNLLLLAIPFLMTYLRLYDSNNKKERFLAYLCLSISAAVKIYPAIFGLLTLREKRWKETFFLFLNGMFFFMAPFASFGFGESFSGFIRGMMLSSGMQGNWGMGYSFSLKNLTKVLLSILNSEIEIYDNFIFMLIVGVCTVALFFISREKWCRILALSLACVWIPEISYTYTLLLFVVVFLYVINSLNRKCDYVVCLINTLIIIPIGLPSLAYLDIENAHMPLSLPTAIINMAILLLFLVSIITCFIGRKKDKNGK